MRGQSSIAPRPCAQCGALFTPRKDILDRGMGKYCGLACAGLARRVPVVPRGCAHCGQMFVPQARQERRGEGRFCSRPCAYAGRLGPLAERLEQARHRVDAPGSCWRWRGLLSPDGYARLTRRPAHQVAWEVAGGVAIPPNGCILHTCDVRDCTRNDDHGWYEIEGMQLPRVGHLYLGTRGVNNTDAATKQRARAQLTAADVEAIRARYRPRVVTRVQLAAEYGVSLPTISAVLSRRSWRHIP